MKFTKLLFAFALCISLISMVSSCGGKAQKSTDQPATTEEQTGKEYTSAYVCPMHCDGSGSDQPGKCPVCGMEYEKNEDHKDDAHDHDGHNHDGHNH